MNLTEMEAIIDASRTDIIVLNTEVRRLRDVLREIALAGTDRPAAMGGADDGDGWYRGIAHRLISTAARAITDDVENKP